MKSVLTILLLIGLIISCSDNSQLVIPSVENDLTKESDKLFIRLTEKHEFINLMNDGKVEVDYFEKLMIRINHNEILSPLDQHVIELAQSYQSFVYSEFSEYFMLLGKNDFTAQDVNELIHQMEYNLSSYQYKTDPGWEECIKECSRKTASCKFVSIHHGGQEY